MVSTNIWELKFSVFHWVRLSSTMAETCFELIDFRCPLKMWNCSGFRFNHPFLPSVFHFLPCALCMRRCLPQSKHVLFFVCRWILSNRPVSFCYWDSVGVIAFENDSFAEDVLYLSAGTKSTSVQAYNNSRIPLSKFIPQSTLYKWLRNWTVFSYYNLI